MSHFNKFSGDRKGNSFGGREQGVRDRGFGGRDSGRPMFSAVCDKCGQSCEVPFRPIGDRPVFCNNCFKTQRGVGSSFAPANFAHGHGQQNAGQKPGANVASIKAQFDAINAKLDRILAILAPVKTAPIKVELPLKEKKDKISDNKPSKKEKAPAKKDKAKKK
ncbi:hypothetical protein HZB94_04030 [Candidatus Falkowbacteria bacterium]|nr:hypothetical protein [Candidatus Falkowbacteria bacterium]